MRQVVEDAAKDRIARIKKALEILTSNLEQHKMDLKKVDWADVGDLGYLASQLEELTMTEDGEEKAENNERLSFGFGLEG